MESSELSGRFLRSAGAATVSQATRVTVAFLVALVLRRLVPEEDWGLWVWAEAAFLIFGALRDLGLNAHVLRVPSRPFGNLLQLELLWGPVLVGLVILAAPWIALTLRGGHPAVVPALRALTVFLFFEGLAMVPLMYFDGELQTGRAVVPEILRNLTFAVIAVLLALRGEGVWSMVVAQAVAAAVFAALLWLRAGRSIPLTFLRGRTLRLVGSSYRLAVIWLLVLLVRYIDRLIIGGRFSAEVLGTYEFAYWAAFIVPMIILHPVGRVAFPAFVRFAEHPRKLFDAYRVSTLALLAIEVPVALFLFLNAPLVLSLIGGTRQWQAAPGYLVILCFAPIVDPFSRLGGEALGARHQDRLWIAATCLTLVSFAVGGLLLTGWLGPVGMAWANFLPLGSLLMIWGVRKIDPTRFQRLAGDLAWIYLLPLPLFAALWLLTEPGWLRLAASLAAIALTLAIYSRRFSRPFRRFFRGLELEPEPEPSER